MHVNRLKYGAMEQAQTNKQTNERTNEQKQTRTTVKERFFNLKNERKKSKETMLMKQS